jgi:hypothetical protein
MEISSVILAIYLFRGMLGIVGLLDHKDVQGRAQKAGDIYNFVYVFLGIGFIITFIYRVDTILSTINTVDFFNHDRLLSFNITPEMNPSTVLNKASDLSNYYGSLIHFHTSPIDLSLFSGSIFTFVLPLSLWFLFGVLEDIHKKDK